MAPTRAKIAPDYQGEFGYSFPMKHQRMKYVNPVAMDKLVDEKQLEPWEEANRVEMAERVRVALKLSNYGDARVLRLRFGIAPHPYSLTLEETATVLNRSRQNTAARYYCALRRLAGRVLPRPHLQCGQNTAPSRMPSDDAIRVSVLACEYFSF